MIDHRLEATLSQLADAIQRMRDFAEGMAYEDCLKDPKTRFALERCVEIISEAARRMPQELQEEHPDIPWDDIKGIGSILRHGYDRVDDRIIWGVLKRHLAPLEAALVSIRSEVGLPALDQPSDESRGV